MIPRTRSDLFPEKLRLKHAQIDKALNEYEGGDCAPGRLRGLVMDFASSQRIQSDDP